MFGRFAGTPTRDHAVSPRSPYGVASGHYITVNYRESYDIFAVGNPLQPRSCAAPKFVAPVTYGVA
jgi:GDPmannose 4,6-dehydratase